MESRKLIDLLRATIDPNQRQQAEEQLAQVCENMCLFHMHICLTSVILYYTLKLMF